MTTKESFNQLNAEKWASISVKEKLSLLKKVQQNLKVYAKELGESDAAMKNNIIGEDLVSSSEGMSFTVGFMAAVLTGIRNLYESLIHGEMPKPLAINKISDSDYEIEVYPIFPNDKLAAGNKKGYIHVSSNPKQISPMDKPAGVIAVLGAGNYSCSTEMVKALFLENKAVIHRPHRMNIESDKVWEEIFAPIVEVKGLVFCDADQGRAITALDGLHSIYFTGSTPVGHAIQDAASVPVVSECGGNNPCIIVPAKWTEKEIKHQAMHLASIGKLNGGAACGRPQTIITSKNWPQRDEFLTALRKAIKEETYACSTYYPGVEKTKEAFLKNQPTAEIIKTENGRYKASDFVFIPNIKETDFAVSNEAFCQIYSEISLDTSEDINDFLTKAIDFSNNKLLGSLACMILVDDETFKNNERRVRQATNELNYGGISVNTMPPNIWTVANLTWGGNGETTENFVSGVGNFGNGLNFENVTKSVLIDEFNSPNISLTSREEVDQLYEQINQFSLAQFDL